MKTSDINILYSIRCDIEKHISNENRLCNEYCTLNPSDSDLRKRDRDLMILAYQLVLCDVNKSIRLLEA